jgi:hypothetical protein
MASNAVSEHPQKGSLKMKAQAPMRCSMLTHSHQRRKVAGLQIGVEESLCIGRPYINAYLDNL